MAKRFLFFISSSFLLLTGSPVFSQQTNIYNHYFLNPYLYNPAYLASQGYSEVSLNFRKQWVGVEGAPTTSTFNLQLPFNHKSAVGLWLQNDQVGLFNTNTGYLSFRHQVYFGRRIDSEHKLGFGMSFGVSNSRINGNKADNPTDPAILNQATSYFAGQVGLNYQFRNFKIAFAIPQLFQSSLVSQDKFSKPVLSRLQTTISSISYNFILSHSLSFEPFALYRTTENLPSQYEVLGVLRIRDALWAGGSYRQDYGSAAFLGFTIKQSIKIGYAYEFALSKVKVFGDGTHEVQVSIRLGKKKSRPERLEDQTVAEEEPEPTEEKPVTPPVVDLPAEEQKAEETPVDVPQEAVTEPNVEPTPQPQVEPEQEDVTTLELPPSTPAADTDASKLTPGFYVVVGVFGHKNNAVQFVQTLTKAGYKPEMDLYPTKDYFFVHLGRLTTLDEARAKRDEVRQGKITSVRQAWVLHIK